MNITICRIFVMFMRVIIAGGGDMGKGYAEALLREGHDAVIIEKDERRAEALAEAVDALVMHGDATEKGILRDADTGSCDAFAALTGDDKANLLAALAAIELGAGKVAARVNDPKNEEAFRKEGVKLVINTTAMAISFLSKAFAQPGAQRKPGRGGRKYV